MHRRLLMLSFVPVLITVAFGCAEKPVEHTVKKVPAETGDEAGESKAAFERMLSGKLEKLEAEIRELKLEVEKLEDMAKEKWTEEVAELEAKRQAARKKLEEVAEATGEAWRHLQEGATKAWEDLEEAVRKARAHEPPPAGRPPLPLHEPAFDA